MARNRYGRNQKRKHRALIADQAEVLREQAVQITKLEKQVLSLGAEANYYKHQRDSITAAIARVAGEHSVFLTPIEHVVSGQHPRDFYRLPVHYPMTVRIEDTPSHEMRLYAVDLYRLHAWIEQHPDDFNRALHVRLCYEGPKGKDPYIGYMISPEALRMNPRRAVEHVFHAMTELFVKILEGR